MSSLADYIMGLLVFNVFLVIIVLALVLVINATVSKQHKEVAFLYVRAQRAKKIEEIRDVQLQEVADKEKKARQRYQKKP